MLKTKRRCITDLNLEELIDSDARQYIPQSEIESVKKHGRLTNKARVINNLCKHYDGVQVAGRGKNLDITLGRKKIPQATTERAKAINLILCNLVSSYEFNDSKTLKKWLDLVKIDLFNNAGLKEINKKELYLEYNWYDWDLKDLEYTLSCNKQLTYNDLQGFRRDYNHYMLGLIRYCLRTLASRGNGRLDTGLYEFKDGEKLRLNDEATRKVDDLITQVMELEKISKWQVYDSKEYMQGLHELGFNNVWFEYEVDGVELNFVEEYDNDISKADLDKQLDLAYRENLSNRMNNGVTWKKLQEQYVKSLEINKDLIDLGIYTKSDFWKVAFEDTLYRTKHMVKQRLEWKDALWVWDEVKKLNKRIETIRQRGGHE